MTNFDRLVTSAIHDPAVPLDVQTAIYQAWVRWSISLPIVALHDQLRLVAIEVRDGKIPTAQECAARFDFDAFDIFDRPLAARLRARVVRLLLEEDPISAQAWCDLIDEYARVYAAPTNNRREVALHDCLVQIQAWDYRRARAALTDAVEACRVV